MKHVLALFLLFVSFCVCAQPYETGRRSIVFTDNNRNARAVPTDVYYPAQTAGNNVPIVTGTNRFPVVVFGHGFLTPPNAYRWLADTLVKNGYVVAFPLTEEGISPNHLDFGIDLNFLAGRITSLHDSSSSFLFQRLIKRAAISGHSMGGGASFLGAAVPNSAIHAVFNFTAAETTPSATQAALLNFKPTLIFSGSRDCITPESVQLAMYNNSSPACKTFMSFTDGLHCQWANSNATCNTGQILAGCGFSPVSTATILAKTSTLLVPWLDFYLKDFCQQGEIFLNTYNTITGVSTKLRSCLPLPNCGPLPVKLSSFTGKAENGFNKLNWSTATEEGFSHFLVERSADGRRYESIASVGKKAQPGGGATYYLDDLFPYSGGNYYRLRMVDTDGRESFSTIVRITSARKPLAITKLYPVPFKSQVNLQLQADKSQQVTIIVKDILGKPVSQSRVSIPIGVYSLQLQLDHLSAGNYFLQIIGNSGESSVIYKLVKD